MRLALDGYGRGPTSLRGLQLGVLDTLKLARELHQEVPPPSAAPPTPTIRGGRGDHRACRALGLRVVAEGVDRQEQLACLRRYGCIGAGLHELPAAAGRGLRRLAAPGLGARRPGWPRRRPPRGEARQRPGVGRAIGPPLGRLLGLARLQPAEVLAAVEGDHLAGHGGRRQDEADAGADLSRLGAPPSGIARRIAARVILGRAGRRQRRSPARSR